MRIAKCMSTQQKHWGLACFDAILQFGGICLAKSDHRGKVLSLELAIQIPTLHIFQPNQKSR